MKILLNEEIAYTLGVQYVYTKSKVSCLVPHGLIYENSQMLLAPRQCAISF